MSQILAARAAYDDLTRQLDAVRAQVARVEAGAAPAASAASAAVSLRQQKTGLIARMLRSGRVDTSAPEVRQIDRQLVDAEATERQSAAVAAARAEVLAELQEHYLQLHAQLPAAHRELLLAQFAAAEAEIRSELIPALRTACAALGADYARLVGAGKAHCQMAAELRSQYGASVQPLGVEYPMASFDFIAVGFGLGDAGGINNVRINVGAELAAAEAKALQRWRG